jgi:hypothetical protein
VSAVTVLKSRLTGAEGERIMPYDDATGLAVQAPKGKLSWGRGFNLMECGSSGLFEVMEDYLLTQLDTRLRVYPWYLASGDVRGSVFLEIAYSAGLSGLLHFPHMLSAAATGDWEVAASQCAVTNPELKGRYDRLAELLRTGVS